MECRKYLEAQIFSAFPLIKKVCNLMCLGVERKWVLIMIN